MSCKYPETSRSHKFCICCSDKFMCGDCTTVVPTMPNVKPPKTDESNMERAIKLLIDNGYTVTKN